MFDSLERDHLAIAFTLLIRVAHGEHGLNASRGLESVIATRPRGVSSSSGAIAVASRAWVIAASSPKVAEEH
ncbi:MAG: hypothetical protein Q8L48_05300 [Archangium sp.]|nr:hypothetical protein [Archangium sp.]